MERLRFPSVLSLVVFLQLLLLLLHPSSAYALESCSVVYSGAPGADLLVDCKDRKLAAVPDDVPTNVRVLILMMNLLQKINRNDFGNLSELKRLDLNLNHISHVDDGSFRNLSALNVLVFTENNLTELTEQLFQGLHDLVRLDLSGNKIRSISSSAFQSLTNLQTLSLEGNQLQQIIDLHCVLTLPNLQKLSIRDNLFTSFETKDLELTAPSPLRELDVSDNNIERLSLATPVFPYLESVDLSGCQPAQGLTWDVPDKTLLRNITHLDFGSTSISFEEASKVLQSLDSLTHLRLSNMEKMINRGLLAVACKTPTLRRLDLFWNKCPNIGRKLLSCSQLSELDLSDTQMTELSKGSILQMKALRSLTAETNYLTKVPDDIQSLGALKILYLSRNYISELNCEDFMNTTSLEELYLDMNSITSLHACVFERLVRLKVLGVRYNILRTFGDTFKIGLQSLESLDLSKNSLFLFKKGDFKGLTSLKRLTATDNNLRVKQSAFVGLNNLETLTIMIPSALYYNFRGLQQLKTLTIHVYMGEGFQEPDPNHFTALYHLKALKVFTVICQMQHFDFPLEVPVQTFASMRHLEDFTVDNIYISAPPSDMFQFNPRLKNLTITHTDLSDLDPDLFQPIPNLQALDLSTTKLKSLDFLAQSNISKLRYLKLTDNEITVVNETVLQSLPALTYLDLSENPFSCDCSNAGFIQWVLSNSQTQVVNAHQYMCSFPANEKGKKLLDFDVQSCWMNISFLCFTSSSSLVLLTLLSSFIYYFLRWPLVYGFQLVQAFLYDSRKRKKGARHQFDAFVSYSVQDEAWVHREMLPVLEEEQGWRLCLHHRDFQPGKPIMENITDAIYGCRKTICVISQSYLQSEWCSREIQMASFRLFDEQKDVLILLFLEEIPAQQLSPYYRMRKLVKRRTYLSWPRAGRHTGVFWQNVRRALETGDGPADTDLLTGPAEP